MITKLLILVDIFNDAPEPWQFGFQDSAAPGFTGIVSLHNTIGFYLILILLSVGWVLFSVIYYYSSTKNPIAHKYLTHGTRVPAYKLIGYNKSVIVRYSHTLAYCSCKSIQIYSETVTQIIIFSEQSNSLVLLAKNTLTQIVVYGYWVPVITFSNAKLDKALIKSIVPNSPGKYCWLNNINGNCYIGQSITLVDRVSKYYTKHYLGRDYIIVKALNKYGFENFTLIIYVLTTAEQLKFYEQLFIDTTKSVYNANKIVVDTCAGTPKTGEHKLKISEAAKLRYANGGINPMQGKHHSPESKEKIRAKAIGRVVSAATKVKQSAQRGTSIYMYELIDGQFVFVRGFCSIRQAGRHFGIVGHSSIKHVLDKDKLYKSKYKFTKISGTEI